MRDIKFRGKELGTGQWVYGNLVKLADGQVCIIPQNVIGDSIPQYSVDPETVGQCTGLQDRNGKNIYEGDMIFHYDQNCIIEYDHGAFVLKGLHKNQYERAYAHLVHYLIDITIPEVNGSKYDGVTTNLEIIGNRFDNPEPLGR